MGVTVARKTGSFARFGNMDTHTGTCFLSFSSYLFLRKLFTQMDSKSNMSKLRTSVFSFAHSIRKLLPKKLLGTEFNAFNTWNFISLQSLCSLEESVTIRVLKRKKIWIHFSPITYFLIVSEKLKIISNFLFTSPSKFSDIDPTNKILRFSTCGKKFIVRAPLTTRGTSITSNLWD